MSTSVNFSFVIINIQQPKSVPAVKKLYVREKIDKVYNLIGFDRHKVQPPPPTNFSQFKH